MTAATFGTYLALLPAVTITLALRVEQLDPDGAARSLSLVLGVGATVALVSQNVAGMLSDRTRSRFGKRRPWLVAGAALGALCLWQLSATSSVTGLVAGWAGAQLAYNLTLAGLNPLLAEQFPVASRGRAAGLLGLAAPTAMLAGACLVTLALPDLRLALVVPAAVCLATVGWLGWVLPDRRLGPEPLPPLRWRDAAAAFWASPRRHPDFAWAWLSRLLVFVGTAALLGYRVYFLQDELGVPAERIGDVVFTALLLSTAATVACAPLFGGLSDRLGARRHLVAGSAALLAATHLAFALVDGLTAYYVISVVAGVATGCYVAVDLALVADVLPDTGTAGKDMGVFHLANVLPQMLVPAVAPAVLALGNGGEAYRALFLLASAVGLLGALAILPVRAVR
nr:MFS transporter [Motilibacter aurantiacus]